jgi:hypothetical protein
LAVNKKFILVIAFLAWLYQRSDWPLRVAEWRAFRGLTDDEFDEFDTAIQELIGSAGDG